MLDRLEKLSDEFNWLMETENKSNKKTNKTQQPTKQEIIKLLRKSYELFYKFNAKNFEIYQEQTYILKNKLKLGDEIDKKNLHLHNLARIINSLYGDIFILKYDNLL